MRSPNMPRFLRHRPQRGRVAPPLSDRLPALVAVTADVPARLRALRVMVIGVGSVGQHLAEHLARLQVGRLLLVDPKRLKPESTLTHASGPAATGRLKVLVAGRRCLEISPQTQVAVFAGRVHELPLDTWQTVDVVLMATDNHAAEIETGQRCLNHGRPLIHAAVQPEMLLTQIRCFSNADAQGGCPACGFGAADYELMRRQVKFSCEGQADPGGMAGQLTVPPTRSFSFLCALAADLAINQLLRLLLQLGQPVADTVLEFCGYTNRSVISPLPRNPACRCDHSRYAIATAPRLLGESSPADLVSAAGLASSDVPVTFRVGEFTWVERGACACRTEIPVSRFVAPTASRSQVCAQCQVRIQPLPLFTHRDVPAAVLGRFLSRPLRRLGAGNVRFALIRAGERAVLIRDPANASAAFPGQVTPQPVEVS